MMTVLTFLWGGTRSAHVGDPGACRTRRCARMVFPQHDADPCTSLGPSSCRRDGNARAPLADCCCGSLPSLLSSLRDGRSGAVLCRMPRAATEPRRPDRAGAM